MLDGRVLRSPEWSGAAALVLGLLLATLLGGIFMAGRGLLALSVTGLGAVFVLGALAFAGFAGWGQAIPLSGRIMAVADIYDALVNRRCYKEPFPHEESMEIMRSLRGTTFDPVVLDAFLAIEDEITRIAGKFRDEEAAPEYTSMVVGERIAGLEIG